MRKGFSLLEVLVCIAIIAVLASVLFPVIGQTKNRAKETVCVSNMRQVFIAMQLYREDMGEYPSSYERPELLSYLGGKKLICPMNRDVQSVSYIDAGFRAPGEEDRSDKGYQRYFLDCRTQRGQDFPILFDEHHLGIEIGVETGREFYILVRESGSLSHITKKQSNQIITTPRLWPCPKNSEKYSDMDPNQLPLIENL
jgi:prepilin-type N-terminal cleavage/methylation domain-containing protein